MKKTLALISLLAISPLSFAEDVLQLGMVTLDTSASMDVENDELITRLQVFEQGKDPAKLTNMVNKKTALVLDAVKNFNAIKAETSNYSTQPIYDDGKIASWRVSQQLTLETRQFDQMSQFIADINTLANIQSMQFMVSEARAEQVKTKLLKQAISKFKDKAKLISNEFDRSGYEIVSISIDGNAFNPMPLMERSNMMAADMSMKAAPASLEGGSNEVSVQVRGSIKLNQ